jgi:hypothetical protein
LGHVVAVEDEEDEEARHEDAADTVTEEPSIRLQQKTWLSFVTSARYLTAIDLDMLYVGLLRTMCDES